MRKLHQETFLGYNKLGLIGIGLFAGAVALAGGGDEGLQWDDKRPAQVAEVACKSGNPCEEYVARFRQCKDDVFPADADGRPQHDVPDAYDCTDKTDTYDDEDLPKNLRAGLILQPDAEDYPG